MSPPQLQIPSSAVFIYSPRSIDDLKAPLSPTSSLKGVFVRSRPTSGVFSDYEYNEFPGIGDINPSPISSESEESPTTDDILDATDRWARAQAADTRSLAPSTYTTSSRLRIVRRSDADMHAEEIKLARENHQIKLQAQAKEPAAGGTTKAEKDKARRRTWPSYKAIRKTVSNILHRKDSPALTPTGVKAGEVAVSQSAKDAPAERVKPSSASLFSRRGRRRATTDADKASSKGPASPVTGKPATSTDALAYRAQLRRSRSFSGFTNVLTAIDDEEDLDEATAEARDLVAEIRHRWAFEDVPEEDCAGFLFERSVE